MKVSEINAVLNGVPDADETLLAEDVKRWNRSQAQVGRTISPEHRARLTAGLAGIPKSAEHRAAVSATLAGIPKSAEHRAAMSAAKRGKPQSAEHRAALQATRERMPKFRCVHCRKEGWAYVIRRFHNDNCKLRSSSEAFNKLFGVEAGDGTEA